jgi:hypothetical protein
MQFRQQCFINSFHGNFRLPRHHHDPEIAFFIRFKTNQGFIQLHHDTVGITDPLQYSWKSEPGVLVSYRNLKTFFHGHKIARQFFDTSMSGNFILYRLPGTSRSVRANALQKTFLYLILTLLLL